jgi:diguanylate cyclase (GGDEF)-like protein/PAS domain S-box-containing protein
MDINYLPNAAGLVLAALAIAILLLLWNRMLRRQVADRTSELTAAVQSLTHAEKALRATLDSTPNVAVQWFDLDARICYWNKASTHVFGWSEAEAMGRTLDEIGLFSPAQARDFADLLRGIERDGRVLEPAESTYFRKDGTQGVIVSTVFPIPSPSGKHYFACMDIDVTERYRSEERLRATLDNTPGVAVQWFDAEARVLYWNPASEMLYGIDADDALGRRMDELVFTPEAYHDFVEFLQALKRARNTSDARQVTVRGRHGVDVTVLRRACMIPGERGESIFVCVEVDITDSIASEREREQLNTILTRVTDAMPVCLSYLDAEGRYVWTNIHNSERLGTNPDRMIGKTTRELTITATGQWQGSAVEAALDGTAQHDECEWQGADGVTKSYERFVVPDMNAGVLRGCTAVWVDITARKEAEHKIRRLNRVHSVLSHINAALVRAKSRHELFDEACRIAVEDGGFGVAWIGIFNDFTRRVDSVAWAGTDALAFQKQEGTRDLAIAGSEWLAHCIREKKPLLNNDISMRKTSADALQRRAVELGYRSVIFLPLTVNAEVTGLFGMMSKEVDFFTDDEVRLLTGLSGDVAFALEVIDKETRINYLAYYDSLTGLPNRTLFHERLGQLVHTAQQRDVKLALLVVDIRRFRFVNESLGRQAGDTLLRELADRFLQSWAEPDNVGRISGDRFALVLGAYQHDALLLHAVQQSIIESLKVPFEVEGREVTMSSTAGIAVYPEDGVDVDTLFKNAEAALGQAKLATEPYLFYQPQMNARMAEGLLIENRMRRALEKEQFVMHYQPKVSAMGERITGFEALIRWNDPDSGIVGPSQFIPLLEETGMIVEAGQWAMRRVLRDHEAWRQLGLNPPRIAVNVSSVQLRRKDFVDQVRALVTEAAYGECGLDLEITESLLMYDIEGCIAKLNAIRDLGVNIAIDDFGTGYSSLAYLSRLPVNALKIDRAFIEGMLRTGENMSIVSSIISLSHALKIKVIAEGVETREQLDVLRSLECDEIQGYLISRPVKGEDAARLLRQYAAEMAA